MVLPLLHSMVSLMIVNAQRALADDRACWP